MVDNKPILKINNKNYFMYHNAINTNFVATYTPPIIVISITTKIHQMHLECYYKC